MSRSEVTLNPADEKNTSSYDMVFQSKEAALLSAVKKGGEEGSIAFFNILKEHPELKSAALFPVIQNGQKGLLESLVNQGVSLSTTLMGRTVFYAAASSAQLELLKFLEEQKKASLVKKAIKDIVEERVAEIKIKKAIEDIVKERVAEIKKKKVDDNEAGEETEIEAEVKAKTEAEVKAKIEAEVKSEMESKLEKEIESRKNIFSFEEEETHSLLKDLKEVVASNRKESVMMTLDYLIEKDTLFMDDSTFRSLLEIASASSIENSFFTKFLKNVVRNKSLIDALSFGMSPLFKKDIQTQNGRQVTVEVEDPVLFFKFKENFSDFCRNEIMELFFDNEKFEFDSLIEMWKRVSGEDIVFSMIDIYLDPNKYMKDHDSKRYDGLEKAGKVPVQKRYEEAFKLCRLILKDDEFKVIKPEDSADSKSDSKPVQGFSGPATVAGVDALSKADGERKIKARQYLIRMIIDGELDLDNRNNAKFPKIQSKKPDSKEEIVGLDEEDAQENSSSSQFSRTSSRFFIESESESDDEVVGQSSILEKVIQQSCAPEQAKNIRKAVQMSRFLPGLSDKAELLKLRDAWLVGRSAKDEKSEEFNLFPKEVAKQPFWKIKAYQAFVAYFKPFFDAKVSLLPCTQDVFTHYSKMARDLSRALLEPYVVHWLEEIDFFHNFSGSEKEIYSHFYDWFCDFSTEKSLDIPCDKKIFKKNFKILRDRCRRDLQNCVDRWMADRSKWPEKITDEKEDYSFLDDDFCKKFESWYQGDERNYTLEKEMKQVEVEPGRFSRVPTGNSIKKRDVFAVKIRLSLDSNSIRELFKKKIQNKIEPIIAAWFDSYKKANPFSEEAWIDKHYLVFMQGYQGVFPCGKELFTIVVTDLNEKDIERAKIKEQNERRTQVSEWFKTPHALQLYVDSKIGEAYAKFKEISAELPKKFQKENIKEIFVVHEFSQKEFVDVVEAEIQNRYSLWNGYVREYIAYLKSNGLQLDQLNKEALCEEGVKRLDGTLCTLLLDPKEKILTFKLFFKFEDSNKAIFMYYLNKQLTVSAVPIPFPSFFSNKSGDEVSGITDRVAAP